MGRGGENDRSLLDIDDVERFSLNGTTESYEELLARRLLRTASQLDTLTRKASPGSTLQPTRGGSSDESGEILRLLWEQREALSVVGAEPLEASFDRAADTLGRLLVIRPGEGPRSDEDYLSRLRYIVTNAALVSGAERPETKLIVCEPNGSNYHLRRSERDRKTLCGGRIGNLLGDPGKWRTASERGVWQQIRGGRERYVCPVCFELLQKQAAAGGPMVEAADEEPNFCPPLSGRQLAETLRTGFRDALLGQLDAADFGRYLGGVYDEVIDRASAALAETIAPRNQASEEIFRRIFVAPAVSYSSPQSEDVEMLGRLATAIKATTPALADIDWLLDEPQAWLIPVARDMIVRRSNQAHVPMAILIAKEVFPEAIEMLQVTNNYPRSYRNLVLP